MTVIGLTGFAQSGKDTVGKLLEKYGFERLAFADAIYNGLYALNPIVEVVGATIDLPDDYYRLASMVDHVGWDKAKQAPEVRRLLQRYGTEGGRDVHGQRCWVDTVEKQLNSTGRFVITDVRFPNEVEMVKSWRGSVWRIDRPGTGPVNSHVSDDIGHLDVDKILVNGSSLDDLVHLVSVYVSGLL